jgi:membrane protease subunit (stomatin/prohibitin family)
MAANQVELGNKIAEFLRPGFEALGLFLDNFVVENLSLPEELQKMLDTRVGMNMVGDMNRYTQFQVANPMPIAAANEGGGLAGVGAGLGAGMALGQTFVNAVHPGNAPGAAGAPDSLTPAGAGPAASGATPSPAAASGETKFCLECGHQIPRAAKFCPDCGKPQS